jgi:MFS family permease
MLVASAGLAVLALMPHGVSLLTFELMLPCISVGLGSLLPITTVSVQNAVKAHQMGTATGTMNFFRSLGGALIVAGFGAILFIQLQNTDAIGAFRILFAVAACALFLSFLLFLKMPEKPLRTEMPLSKEITPA